MSVSDEAHRTRIESEVSIPLSESMHSSLIPVVEIPQLEIQLSHLIQLEVIILLSDTVQPYLRRAEVTMLLLGTFHFTLIPLEQEMWL